MKKLLRAVAFVLTLYIISAAFIGQGKMNFYNIEYPMRKVKIEYINQKGNENDVLFLGDSRCMAAVAPTLLPFKSYNLSVSGGSTVEGFWMLDGYLKNSPPPKSVYMVYTSNHYMTIDGFEGRTKPFDLFSYKQIHEVDKLLAKNEATSAKIARYFNTALYRLDVFTQYLPELRAAKLMSRRQSNEQCMLDMVSTRGQHFFGKQAGEDGAFGDAKFESFTPDAITDLYFEKIITLCEKNNIALHIVNTPINETTFAQLKPAHVEGFKAYLHGKAQAHSGITVHDDILHLPSSCFGDLSHVNKAGMEIYTKYIGDLVSGS